MCGIANIGFCAGTEDGDIHFFRFISEKKKFEYVCKWTCLDISGFPIVSMATHD
jgi:hypothetical protein